MPTNVTVTKNCSQDFVEVTWQASRGALSYRVTAMDSDDQQVCFSDEPSCRLEGLACSQVYNVRVTAVDNTCSSNESSPVILRTGKNKQESVGNEVFSNSSSSSLVHTTHLFCVLSLQCPALPLRLTS